MYQNIVFDLGGVMVDFAPKDYLVDRLCSAEVEEQVYRLTFGSEEWKQVDAGLLSRSEADRLMLKNAEAAGRSFEVQGVLDEWTRILRPRRKMQELVRRLKSHGYCIYFLSNISQDVLELVMKQGLEGLFDGGLASYEVHINKPDPRIFQAFLERYGLKAEECVFIDDSRPNVQTAIEMGFAGFEMKDSVNTLVRTLATSGIALR
ncbi:MAG: HAD family hydrolase [Faecalibacterium sp.]